MGNLDAFHTLFLESVVLFASIGHGHFVDWGMVDATGMADERMPRCRCILSLSSRARFSESMRGGGSLPSCCVGM